MTVVAILAAAAPCLRGAARPVRAKYGITLRAFPALMMPVVLLGGMRGGVMTPTEASAVAAAYAVGSRRCSTAASLRSRLTMRSW